MELGGLLNFLYFSMYYVMVLSQTFLNGKASLKLVGSLASQFDKLLKRAESGRDLTFADHVDQFYACQDRCG